MSSFDDWLIDYTDNDDWCDRDITQDMEFAYNAGMERAAEITESFPDASNRGALVLCAEVIRKEIEK